MAPGELKEARGVVFCSILVVASEETLIPKNREKKALTHLHKGQKKGKQSDRRSRSIEGEQDGGGLVGPEGWPYGQLIRE